MSSFDLPALMDAVAETQKAIDGVAVSYPSAPKPANAAAIVLPAFINSFEPSDSGAGISGLRINRGTVRMQCLYANAEPGDLATRRRVVVLWQATYDAFCKALTLKGRASVAMAVGGGEVPGLIEFGGKGYLGFELRLVLTNLDEFAWA